MRANSRRWEGSAEEEEEEGEEEEEEDFSTLRASQTSGLPGRRGVIAGTSKDLC